MYRIEKKVVPTIKNYRGRPGIGKETRWYIVAEDGLYATTDHFGYISPSGLYYTKKYMAQTECDCLNKDLL